MKPFVERQKEYSEQIQREGKDSEEWFADADDKEVAVEDTGPAQRMAPQELTVPQERLNLVELNKLTIMIVTYKFEVWKAQIEEEVEVMLENVPKNHRTEAVQEMIRTVMEKTKKENQNEERMMKELQNEDENEKDIVEEAMEKLRVTDDNHKKDEKRDAKEATKKEIEMALPSPSQSSSSRSLLRPLYGSDAFDIDWFNKKGSEAYE